MNIHKFTINLQIIAPKNSATLQITLNKQSEAAATATAPDYDYDLKLLSAG